MLPLSIKQQKLTKLNAVMSPEIKAINAKYKDKRDDQNAMMKMQEETKAVYEKYGVGISFFWYEAKSRHSENAGFFSDGTEHKRTGNKPNR